MIERESLFAFPSVSGLAKETHALLCCHNGNFRWHGNPRLDSFGNNSNKNGSPHLAGIIVQVGMEQPLIPLEIRKLIWL